MNIDLVYLWVNGNDPEWITRRNAFIGKPTTRQENCKGRYADSGELKYSIRSVQQNAPWIRKIFIVTDHQVPEWLDTTNPRVQIVDHTEIMPAECLPCYNSALIEQFLDRIPDLSEHFLYANDDMFINKPITPSTFFAADGLPILYMNRKPLRKLGLWFREHILGKPLSQYIQTIKNASLLAEKYYGSYNGDKLHHNIDAYQKSTLALINQKFSGPLSAMHSHHMRSANDIQRCFYSYAALAEGRGHLRYIGQRFSFRLHIDNRKHYQKFKHYNPVLFCINDSEYATDEDRTIAIQFVSKLFPHKSQFEK